MKTVYSSRMFLSLKIMKLKSCQTITQVKSKCKAKIRLQKGKPGGRLPAEPACVSEEHTSGLREHQGPAALTQPGHPPFVSHLTTCTHIFLRKPVSVFFCTFFLELKPKLYISLLRCLCFLPEYVFEQSPPDLFSWGRRGRLPLQRADVIFLCPLYSSISKLTPSSSL